MLRPELGIAPTAATAPAAPLRVASAGLGVVEGINFAATFGALQSEVRDFIEHGSAWSGGSSSGFSVEAALYRNSGVETEATAAAPLAQQQQEFLATVAPWAQETGKRLGVAPEIVAAQAALESGWGLKPLRQADGRDSNNLFGIKAGAGWRGAVAQALTTEYEDGHAVPKLERFRSYPDRAAAFRDYAQFLLTNPRYRGALNAGADAQAFAQGLAQGGYATDPAYAGKLARIATRVQSVQSIQSGD